jgi:hypothetical protein
MIARCIAKTAIATCCVATAYVAAIAGLLAAGLPIVPLSVGFWLIFGLFIGYQSDRLWNSDTPVVWVISGALGGLFAFPVFWYCKESHEARKHMEGRCSNCGSDRLVPILRGRAALEGNEIIRRGEAVPGSSMPRPTELGLAPTHHCKQCHEEFVSDVPTGRMLQAAQRPQEKAEGRPAQREMRRAKGAEGMIIRINPTVPALVAGLAALLASGTAGAFLLHGYVTGDGGEKMAAAFATQSDSLSDGRLTPTLVPTPTVESLGLGWERYVSAGKGYEIDVPASWLVVPDFPVGSGGQTGDEFRADCPPAEFCSGVQVFSAPSYGRSFAQLFALEQAQFREAASAGGKVDITGDIKVERLTIGTHEAGVIHATVSAPQMGDVAFQYSEVVLVAGGREWYLSLAAQHEDWETYWPVFQRMYQSFTVR